MIYDRAKKIKQPFSDVFPKKLPFTAANFLRVPGGDTSLTRKRSHKTVLYPQKNFQLESNVFPFTNEHLIKKKTCMGSHTDTGGSTTIVRKKVKLTEWKKTQTPRSLFFDFFLHRVVLLWVVEEMLFSNKHKKARNTSGVFITKRTSSCFFF